MPADDERTHGVTPQWRPRRPSLRPRRLLLQWVTSALALYVAALLVPGVKVEGFFGALLAAALIAVLNAIVPPLIAALRLPYMLAAGFLIVRLLDAWMVKVAADMSDHTFTIPSYWQALLVSLVAAAVSVALEVLLGTNDDDVYGLRVTQRVARRSHERVVTDVPGIIYLEIDGLARPVLQRAMRDGHAPEMARWVTDGSHRLDEWETDLSSQTGASQAGLLMGSNDDIPAFRWVEKESGRVMTCSAPPDCALIEERHSSGRGLLVDGGASRSNLLSGEADHVILTVSRIEAEKKANPGYRAYLADGYNITRTLVLFLYELVIEWTAAAKAIRRDVRPRGHRPLKYSLVRAGLAVFVRDLTVFSVISDMMKGVPALYACFAGYDEVAHHSGLERSDTMEVLRKIDQQFGRIERARRYAARPYEIVVLSDHGQTQGATFKQRNGYGLDDLVRRSIEGGAVAPLRAGDENDTAVARAVREATGAKDRVPAQGEVAARIHARRQARRSEITSTHPDLARDILEGRASLRDDRVDGADPLAGFSVNAGAHLRRSDAFAHVADIMVNSFYDEQIDEGCAFEELISFHGGMGGPQTRPFLLHPARLPVPAEPIVGAEAAHDVLAGWRRALQGG